MRPRASASSQLRCSPPPRRVVCFGGHGRRFDGALGGATGFAGIILTIWSTLRGWTPPEQRAVFQPVGVSVFLTTALFLGGTGTVSRDTIWLFLIGLPALAAGNWAGLKLFARLDEVGFRRVVLGLLLVSGVSLLLHR
jgi:uncharacterized protein